MNVGNLMFIDPATSPRCECGHRLYDHLSERSRCNEASKQCRCMLFHREDAK